METRATMMQCTSSARQLQQCMADILQAPPTLRMHSPRSDRGRPGHCSPPTHRGAGAVYLFT